MGAGLLLGSAPIADILIRFWDQVGHLLNQLPGFGSLTDPGTRLRVHMAGDLSPTIDVRHLWISAIITMLLAFVINIPFLMSRTASTHTRRDLLKRIDVLCLALFVLCLLSAIARSSLEAAGASAWNTQSNGTYTNPLPFSAGPAALILHLAGLLLLARFTVQILTSCIISRAMNARQGIVPSCPQCLYPTSEHKSDTCPECGKHSLSSAWSTLYTLAPNRLHRVRMLAFRLSSAIVLYAAPIWWYLVCVPFRAQLRLVILPMEWGAFAPWWVARWFL